MGKQLIAKDIPEPGEDSTQAQAQTVGRVGDAGGNSTQTQAQTAGQVADAAEEHVQTPAGQAQVTQSVPANLSSTTTTPYSVQPTFKTEGLTMGGISQCTQCG